MPRSGCSALHGVSLSFLKNYFSLEHPGLETKCSVWNSPKNLENSHAWYIYDSELSVNSCCYRNKNLWNFSINFIIFRNINFSTHEVIIPTMLKIRSHVIRAKFRIVVIKVFSLTSFTDKVIPKDIAKWQNVNWTSLFNP